MWICESLRRLYIVTPSSGKKKSDQISNKYYSSDCGACGCCVILRKSLECYSLDTFSGALEERMYVLRGAPAREGRVPNACSL